MPDSDDGFTIRLQVKDFDGFLYQQVVWKSGPSGFHALRPNNIQCSCGRTQWLQFVAEVREVNDVERS